MYTQLLNKRLLLVLLAMAAASFFLLDAPVARAVQHTPPGYTLPYIQAFSQLGESLFWFVALAVWGIAIVVMKRREQLQLWVPAMLSLATSSVLVQALKLLTSRLRPSAWLRGDELVSFQWFAFEAGTSFPSGHAQTIACVMTLCMLHFPRYRALWLAIALAVCATRVILAKHFISDVVMGAYIGMAVTLLIHRWYANRKHT